MGVVYRAYDRLTDSLVALKHVKLFGARSPDETEPELLALAQEFRLLAGLRHPHIISVLDYGFDHRRRPFYSMELLDSSTTILDAGRGADRTEQIALLIQALEALAYLHRRGILHHDLKPANILVLNRHLRLLDFGLAMLTSQQREHGLSGTLQYLAPEVLDGAPYTAAADLYSLGIVAYELLIGRHPFLDSDFDTFITQVFTSNPDVSALAAEPALADILSQLLSKDPLERPASAQAVITALRRAAGIVAGETTSAIRDSYLQAATFVGREAELATLTGALEHTRQGQGGTLLIGGESGIGKSRLLEELRVHAMVTGFRVLYGQGVMGGGLPYQFWREPLRRLALEMSITDGEAGVLREIVPDIERLIGRPAREMPRLTNADQQERLQLTICDLFQRIDQPTLLILEDLQWANESLMLLRLLQPDATRLPLCIICTYRSDERPNLAHELAPELQQVQLNPLSADNLVALTSAMLGAANVNPQLVTFLQRETEGNAFFVVETVRALADQAGDLEQVGQMVIPETVSGGGVLQVLWRRLAQMPDWGRPLLNLAAIYGRILDRQLLANLAPAIDLEYWLTMGAAAAIFEVYDGNWRFRHDKLREAALAELAADERQILHHHIAQALETLYGNQPAYAQPLYDHWRDGGEYARAVPYAATLAEKRLNSLPIPQVIAFAEEALSLSGETIDDTSATRLWLVIGMAYQDKGDLDAEQAALIKSIEHARRLANPLYHAHALVTLGWSHCLQRKFYAALAYTQDAIELAATVQDDTIYTHIYNLFGCLYVDLQQYDLARASFERGLDHARAANDASRITSITNNLAVLVLNTGDYRMAHHYFTASLEFAEASGNRTVTIVALNNLGMIAMQRYDHQAALPYLNKCLALERRLGNRRVLGRSLANLGICYAQQFEWPHALLYLDEGLAIGRDNKDYDTEGQILHQLAVYWIEQHNLAEAQRLLDEAAAIAEAAAINDLRASVYHLQGVMAHIRGEAELSETAFANGSALVGESKDMVTRARLLTDRGLCRWSRRELAEAEADVLEALELERAIDAPRGEATCLAYLALAAAARGEHETAHDRLNEANDRLGDGEFAISRTLLAVVRVYLAYATGDNTSDVAQIVAPDFRQRLTYLQQLLILRPIRPSQPGV